MTTNDLIQFASELEVLSLAEKKEKYNLANDRVTL